MLLTHYCPDFFQILLNKPGPLVEPPLNIILEYDKSVSGSGLSKLEEKMLSLFKKEVRMTPRLTWVPALTLPREMKKTNFIKVRELKA